MYYFQSKAIKSKYVAQHCKSTILQLKDSKERERVLGDSLNREANFWNEKQAKTPERQVGRGSSHQGSHMPGQGRHFNNVHGQRIREDTLPKQFYQNLWGWVLGICIL